MPEQDRYIFQQFSSFCLFKAKNEVIEGKFSKRIFDPEDLLIVNEMKWDGYIEWCEIL